MLRLHFNLHTKRDSYLVAIYDSCGITMNIENEETGQVVTITNTGIVDLLSSAKYLPGETFQNCYYCGYPQLQFGTIFCHMCCSVMPDKQPTVDFWYWKGEAQG